MTASTETLPEIDRLRADLAQIEEKVVTNYTLADSIREGSSVTSQRYNGWIAEGESCAMGAAWIAAKARGYIK